MLVLLLSGCGGGSFLQQPKKDVKFYDTPPNTNNMPTYLLQGDGAELLGSFSSSGEVIYVTFESRGNIVKISFKLHCMQETKLSANKNILLVGIDNKGNVERLSSVSRKQSKLPSDIIIDDNKICGEKDETQWTVFFNDKDYKFYTLDVFLDNSHHAFTFKKHE